MGELIEEIKRIIVESMYLGISKEKLLDIINSAYEDNIIQEKK